MPSSRSTCGEGRWTARPPLYLPLHAWSYDLDGNLVSVPHASGFEGLCREERGLVALPVAEKHGLIFVRLRPGGSIDIDDHLAGLGPELTEFKLDRFRREASKTSTQAAMPSL